MFKRPLLVIFAVYLLSCLGYLFIMPVPGADPYKELDRQDISFSGRLIRKEYRLSEEGVKEGIIYLRIPGRSSSVQVYTDTPVEELPETGRILTVKGRAYAFHAATNPGEFDSRIYYIKKNVAFRISDAGITDVKGRRNIYTEALFTLRMYLGSILDDTMGEKEAGVMKALILGDRACLDDDIKELYRESGILHIIAVSGLHISFLGNAFLRLFKRMKIPFFVSCPLIIALMLSYSLMCGMATSALRALIMFSLRILAPAAGRSYDLLSAMSLSGLTILFENVHYAADAGFLMSFGAVAAIGILLPSIRRIPFFEKKKGLSSSVAVTLFTLPVYHALFYSFPLYAVLLNVAVIPMTAVLLPVGWITLAAGGISDTAAAPFAFASRSILKIYELMCEGSMFLPFSSLTVGRAAPVQIICYLVSLALFICICNRKGARAVCKKRCMLILVPALIALFIRVPPSLKITMVDVGQGDAIVIRTREATVLIDGGSTSASSVGRYRIKPYLKHEGEGKLDAVLITHDDEDHISGVRELIADTSPGRIRIAKLIMPDIASSVRGDNYNALVSLAKEKGIAVEYARRGQSLTFGDVTLSCLFPDGDAAFPDPNEGSGVWLLKKGSFKALFTGDIEGAGLDILNGYLKDTPDLCDDLTLLKVAHHGSRYTTDETFLSLVDADLALISCGRDNRYGHPHAETLERLTDDGSRIMVSAISGAVELTVSRDGKETIVRQFIKNDK